MVFQINQVYRDNVPRGIPEVLLDSWSTTDTDAVEIEAATTEYIRIKSVTFSPSSFSFTGASLLTITFPTEAGTADITITIDTIEELYMLASEVRTIDSREYMTIVFEAPVWLRGDKTSKTFQIAFTATSLDTGEIQWAVRGWKVGVEDYE